MATSAFTCYHKDIGGCGRKHRTEEDAKRCTRGRGLPIISVPATWSTARIRRERGPLMPEAPAAGYAHMGPCKTCTGPTYCGILCSMANEPDHGRSGGTFVCSRPPGHAGPHIACAGRTHYVGHAPNRAEPEAPEPESESEAPSAGARVDPSELAEAIGEAIGALSEQRLRDQWHDAETAIRTAREEAVTAVNAVAAETRAALEPERVETAVRDALAAMAPRVIEIRRPEAPPVRDDSIAHAGFPLLLSALAAGATRVLLVGPPGWGKTQAAERAAELLGRPLYLQTPIADRFEAVGFRDATGTYQETELYRWATDAREGAILVLDEMDAIQPNAAVALNAALANGVAVFPHRQVRIPRSHVVIANGNTWGGGATAQFSGRMRQDAAFMRRFPTRIAWGEDAEFELRVSIAYFGGKPEWVRIGQKIRANLIERALALYWHPTDTYSYCQLRAGGLSHADAISLSALASLDSEQRADALKGVEAC